MNPRNMFAVSMALAIAAFQGTALAQTAVPSAPPAAAMDHSKMQMPADPAAPAAMDHSKMQMPAGPAAPAAMDHSKMQMPASPAAPAAMDHGEMQMQGGSAPPDARDPHAYSGGYTLTTGPYIAAERLRLGDESIFATLMVNKLEGYRSDGDTTGSYELQARVGRDYNRLVLKAEGEVARSKLQESRTEALWSRAFATFWDTQAGLRYDTGEGRNRTWAAFGVQGLAPYWFEVDATFYVGGGGRTALRLSAEYDLLLTQKLVLQPSMEVNFYGKNDVDNGIGRGLSDVTAGLRLRYEFTREFAPYIGVEWSGRYGRTADLARAAGQERRDARIVAGVRIWF